MSVGAVTTLGIEALATGSLSVLGLASGLSVSISVTGAVTHSVRDLSY